MIAAFVVALLYPLMFYSLEYLVLGKVPGASTSKAQKTLGDQLLELFFHLVTTVVAATLGIVATYLLGQVFYLRALPPSISALCCKIFCHFI